MLELGAFSAELHRDAGRAAAAAGLDRLFVVGGEAARKLGEAAIAAGMAPASVTYFDQSAAAATPVAAAIRSGDVVLVKGSRGTRTDVIADRIAEAFG
jgi:UDP-N-acetylmuramoyl-tripeptide--D-alanyl-D-alanine ligase